MTVAGAVSLGSFEAGVMFELLDALAQHNASAAPDSRVTIDVLTGASAGGMTAALTAQKLLFAADTLAAPYNNHLYNPWVRDVNLDGLMSTTPADDPTKSVFASSLIDAISKSYLTRRYTSPPRPPTNTHSAAAKQIKLGLAMSNLNGVDYRHTVAGTAPFVYTRYEDTYCKDLDTTNASDALEVWEPIRVAAVCCGAFPFAFRARDLLRRQADYAAPNLAPFPRDPYSFTYTDGGVFQNEPLGLAKDLVDQIDQHADVDNRFYLFVSPGARLSTRDAGFNEGGATLKATGVAVVEAIFNQARFQDWITAERVNSRLQLFNERAEQLRQLLLSRSLDAQTLAPAVNAILSVMLATATQRQSTARLQEQFGDAYTSLASAVSPDAAQTWIRTLLVFETAADLATRDEMSIFGITAEAPELAGSDVMAFAGFFDQRYRDHDYDVGRTKARAFLTSPSCPLGALRYTPKPVNPIDHTLDGFTIDRASQSERQDLADRLMNRANELLEELDIGTVTRWGVRTFFLQAQINKLLGL